MGQAKLGAKVAFVVCGNSPCPAAARPFHLPDPWMIDLGATVVGKGYFIGWWAFERLKLRFLRPVRPAVSGHAC